MQPDSNHLLTIDVNLKTKSILPQTKQSVEKNIIESGSIYSKYQLDTKDYQRTPPQREKDQV